MACDGPVAAVAWGPRWLRFGDFPVSRLSHRVSHRQKASVNPALCYFYAKSYHIMPHYAHICCKAGFTEAFLRCDTRCDSRETGKSPNRNHRGPHATDATGPSQAIAEVELGSTFAMRQAIWRTILTFSTAKLYKGSRVAYKFVQVVSNRANIMVT